MKMKKQPSRLKGGEKIVHIYIHSGNSGRNKGLRKWPPVLYLFVGAWLMSMILLALEMLR